MARDKIHSAVKNALVKDGWIITADPYFIRADELELQADLAAERPIAAEKAGSKIVVEIKSFLGRSLISEFYIALGQYMIYHHFLARLEPDRVLFLAVSDLVYNDFFQLEIIQTMVKRQRMAILVVNTAAEEVVEWIKWIDTVN
jgi:hypothetical protein